MEKAYLGQDSCLTKVFSAWIRMVANGFFANSGLDRMSGCRNRSIFL